MLIPPSISLAYEESRAVAEAVMKYAGTKLQIICADNNWLFDQRIKSEESCLAKLEAGGPPLHQLHDLYAAMVVVPTQSEVNKAVAVVKQHFSAREKTPRTTSPDSFIYDDVHLIAQLIGPVSRRSAPKPVLEREFEIQIHTGLQYAWWRATHDQIYKGDSDESRRWGVSRSSGQAKAALELLDVVLSDLPAAGRMQRAAPIPDLYQGEPAKWLSLWPKSHRPHDVHRFTETVVRLTAACKVELGDVALQLTNQPVAGLIGQRGVTPTQAILAAVSELVGPDLAGLLSAAKVRVLVTPELIALRPELSELAV